MSDVSYLSSEETAENAEVPPEKKRRICNEDKDQDSELIRRRTVESDFPASKIKTKSSWVDQDKARSGKCIQEINISQNKFPDEDEFSDSHSVYELATAGSSSSFDFTVDDPLFWGPYLSERQWGTVREDFSPNDSCWEHVSYENAIQHEYVSGEDGLLGVSDKSQLFCASLALWNGKDPFLKERLFGLTGVEGNHGEDVKELYYYQDSLPDHSYMKALYKYPQEEFPYQRLREENKNRTFNDAEFELIDTGIFDENGYWDVVVEYAKTDNLGLACHIEVVNCSGQEKTLHIIPQFWFRHVQKNEPVMAFDSELKACKTGNVKVKYTHGKWRLIFMPDNDEDSPTLLFTNNTSAPGQSSSSAELHTYTKDAFHRYIVQGYLDAVNPKCCGTKCGAHFCRTVAAGQAVSVYWRIESAHYPLEMSLSDLKKHFHMKKKDAYDYYNKLMPGWSKEERNIGIQALAGLFWSKQFYLFDVRNWLEDYRRCQENRGSKGRNFDWSHVRNHHLLLMPDKWEFPWYAGWDLCISAVLYARYCSSFAKEQMTQFLSDCFMHPRGQLPGCEFELGDPNPPLQAWAVLKIFQIDGSTDLVFLRKCFHRLLLNYNWWCNREFDSTYTYGRGFLGMDNISVIDRSGPLPQGWSLVQADCSAWMACYCLWLLQIAVELSHKDSVYLDLIPKFLAHFIHIAIAINKPIAEKVFDCCNFKPRFSIARYMHMVMAASLWHEQDRFCYDVFHTPHGQVPIRLRSMAGLIPLLACAKFKLCKQSTPVICFEKYRDYQQHLCMLDGEVFMSVLCLPKVQSVLKRVFSPNEFLSPYGIRSLSKVYEAEPFSMTVDHKHYTVEYVPGESNSGAFGGNSNWRGPVWVFMNYLLLECLDKYSFRAKYTLDNLLHHRGVEIEDLSSYIRTCVVDLEKRLLAIFMPNEKGQRPVHGSVSKYADDPKWRHLVLFYEFIHADTGRGCGASHQTGWTASILEVLYRIHSH